MVNKLEKLEAPVVAEVVRGITCFGLEEINATDSYGAVFPLVVGDMDTLQFLDGNSRLAVLGAKRSLFVAKEVLDRIRCLRDEFSEEARKWVSENVSFSDDRQYSDLAMGLMLYEYEIFNSCYFNDDECNEVQLSDRMFVVCEMKKLLIKEADISGVHFRGCLMDGINFLGSELKDVVFLNCSINGANFRDVDLINVRFYNCELIGVDFAGARFSGDSRFVKCTLDKTSFDDAVWVDGPFFEE